MPCWQELKLCKERKKSLLLANMTRALVRKQPNAFAEAKPTFTPGWDPWAALLLKLPDPVEAEGSILAAPWLALLAC